MEAGLDHKESIAVTGIMLTLMGFVVCGIVLFPDIRGLLMTGEPHLMVGTRGRSAGIAALDRSSGGWFSILCAGALAAYLVHVFLSWKELFMAPQGVIHLENGSLHFNKGLFVNNPVALSDVDSVDLSFDPNDPKSRKQHWIWGDGMEQLSISFRKPDGALKSVKRSARRVAGGCDALINFAAILQTELRLARQVA